MNDTETWQASLNDEIDIGRYLAALGRWWRLIVLCAILGGLAALLVGFLSAKSYQANSYVVLMRTGTVVNLDSKIRSVSNTDPTSGQTVDLASLRKTLTLLADSEDLAQSVFGALQTQLASNITDPSTLHSLVQITNDGDTFQIVVRSQSPEQAALIANAWAQEFITRANAIYGESPISLDTLAGQLQAARSDYDAQERALVAFVREAQAPSLQRQRDEKVEILNTLAEGKTIAVQAVITETQQTQIRLLRDYLNAVGDTRSAVFTQQAQARVQKLRDLYALRLKLERLTSNAQALRARLAQSSTQTQAGNSLALTLLESSAFTTWADLPVSLQVPLSALDSEGTVAEQQLALDSLIAEIEKQRAALQTQIADASKELLGDSGYAYLEENTFDAASPLSAAIQQRAQALLNLQDLEDIASYESSDAAVVAAIDKLQKDINTLDAQIEVEEAKKRDLTRARDLAWDTYTALASKLAESQVTADAGASIVRLATAAVPPTQPTGGGLTRVALGLFLGLLVGVVLAFLLEFFATGFPDAAHVQKALNLSTLATIPVFTRASGQSSLPQSVLEALRGVRYQLFEQRKARGVMVTSAIAGEGVTTIATNLATVAAQGGMNVLLIDANLRQPMAHTHYQLELAPGLTNMLNATETNLDLYAHRVNPNLTVLTAGSPTADPAALLQHKSFELVVRQAQAKFDAIIIDAPPVNGMIDAVEIARAADGALLVIDGAHTARAPVLQAQAALAASDASILGVLLNRVGRGVASDTPKSDAMPLQTLWTSLRTRLFALVGPRSG